MSKENVRTTDDIKSDKSEAIKNDIEQVEGIKLLLEEIDETEEERIKREKEEFEAEISQYKKATMYGSIEDELGSSFFDGDLPDEEPIKMASLQASGPWAQAQFRDSSGSSFNLPITDDILSKANPDFTPKNRFEYRPELEEEISGKKWPKVVLKNCGVFLAICTALVLADYFLYFGLDNFMNFMRKFVVIGWIAYLMFYLAIQMIIAREQKGFY